MTGQPRILFVDDEPLVLSGVRRSLSGSFRVETAVGGEEGLQLLQASLGADPFAVVVSDMQMPGMNGAEFLQRARTVVPDAVLMILSGQADLESTVAAVNSANLFRFLTKPCAPDHLQAGLRDALRQYQLVMAERELLDRTLSKAVDVLVDVLAIANPQAFSRARRIAALTEAAAAGLGLDDDWQLRVAARLSQVGCIAVPEALLEKIHYGGALAPTDQAIYATHPEVARELVAAIPRLELVATWIGSQPTDPPPALDTAVPVAPARGVEQDGDTHPGRTLLHAAIAFVAARDAGRSPGQAVTLLETRYPREQVRALYEAGKSLDTPGESREVGVADIRIGMVIEQDIVTPTGMMLVRSGEQISDTVLRRLRNFADTVGVVEPIRVLVAT